jgi:hypothetical protein
VINPFASAATRDATITGASKVAGMHTWQTDDQHTKAYNGSIWYPVAPQLVGARDFVGSVTSTGTEQAVTAWTNAGPSFVVHETGHIYKWTLTVSLWNSGAAGDGTYDNTIRIRQTVNSTSSTVIFRARMIAAGGSSPIVTHQVSGWYHCTTAVNSSLGLTITKSTGGDAVLTGNTTDSPTRLEVWDMGPTARLSATQLTASYSVAIS